MADTQALVVGKPEALQDLTDHTAGWDWENKHVSGSFDDGTTKNVSVADIIESGTVLIAAGPADLDQATANGTISSAGIRVVPIGLVETVQVNMNKPLSRIFEIGSKLSYIIPGRTVGGIAINRVFFDGPSLLKVLYYGEIVQDASDGNFKRAMFASDPNYYNTMLDGMSNIGSGNITMNLASTFFDRPTGLAFYFRDRNSNSVGEIYFEGCNVNSYNLGISANMNVLTESINMEFVRCRPIVTVASTTTTMPKGGGLPDLSIIGLVDK
jgi:hypothetical protein